MLYSLQAKVGIKFLYVNYLMPESLLLVFFICSKETLIPTLFKIL